MAEKFYDKDEWEAAAQKQGLNVEGGYGTGSATVHDIDGAVKGMWIGFYDLAVNEETAYGWIE